MKLTVSVLAAGLLWSVMLCGCNAENQQAAGECNAKEVPVIDLYKDLAIQNAVITQRTVYPYHFVNNGAELNTLGQRDMAVLAAHFAQHPGELIVQRGDAGGELYQQRLESVMARLAEGGVDRSRIRAHDGMPGGDGMSTTDIIGVLERSREPLTNTNVSDYGTSFVTQP